jgi:urea transporter
VILTVALGMCSLISMTMAILGSFVGTLVGMFFGAPRADIIAGVWGSNSALAGIAVRCAWHPQTDRLTNRLQYKPRLV